MINLRAIEREDLPILKNWRNSDQVFPFVREYRLLSQADQEEWFEAYRKIRRNSEWGQELMVIESDGLPIGIGGFVRMEWRNQKTELSFYLYAPAERFIREALPELLKKGFTQFNFHKIYWPVYGHDSRLPIYKEIFKEEAVLKEEYFWNGKFQDRHYLSLTKKEFDEIEKLK